MRHKWMLATASALALTMAARGQSNKAEALLGAGLHQEEVDGNCKEAIKTYQKVIQEKNAPKHIAARAQLHIGACHEKLGQREARVTYELVLAKYVDQVELAAEARSRIAALGTVAIEASSPTDPEAQLAWFDRTGKLIESVGTPGVYAAPSLSPDGKRFAIHRDDKNGRNIWLFEGSKMSQLTFAIDGQQTNSQPIWSPDGSRVAFGSRRNGKEGLYVKRVDGSGPDELLVETDSILVMPTSWSPDGRYIVYRAQGQAADLWLLPLTGDRMPKPLIVGPGNQNQGRISPDGKWIAYFSNRETGFARGIGIFIKPFPDGPGVWQVSEVGHHPMWRGDGKELYFLHCCGDVVGKVQDVMAAEIRMTGQAIESGPPRRLFGMRDISAGYKGGRDNDFTFNVYEVSPDGQRFLFPRPIAAAPSR